MLTQLATEKLPLGVSVEPRRGTDPAPVAPEPGLEDRGISLAERREWDLSCFPRGGGPCTVHEDAEDPRPKRGTRLEPTQASQHRQPRFLHHFVGRGGGAHERARDPAKRAVVVDNELLESLLVARPQPYEQVLVVVHRHEATGRAPRRAGPQSRSPSSMPWGRRPISSEEKSWQSPRCYVALMCVGRTRTAAGHNDRATLEALSSTG